eukprot:184742-Prymnesium_polylepis.1
MIHDRGAESHMCRVALDKPSTSSAGLGGTAHPEMNVARLHPTKDQAAAFQERPDLSWSVHGGDMFLMCKAQASDKGPRAMKKAVSWGDKLCETVEIPSLLRAPSILKRPPGAPALEQPAPPPSGTISVTYLIRAAGDGVVGFAVDEEKNTVISECDRQRGTLREGDRIMAVNRVEIGPRCLFAELPAGRCFVLFDVLRETTRDGARSAPAPTERAPQRSYSLGSQLD